ncbi:zona pellucida-like domain-containing protein 1 [Centropristis striata]|uniref:zona pellucida-like domain-containing protein 1 n=1 Tax=Centropristis striata TaxID=184440 RepID=UPI0027DFE9CE|nr:zona pellucida-like domain-containing protein 1 [Centropristis striata]
MRLVILVCQLVLILRTEAQIPDECMTSDTNRAPENTDISVECGTEYMEVSIFLCPVYNALYNESLMVPNNQMNTPECLGTPDWTVDPPVLRFRFPLHESSVSSCNHLFTEIIQVGSGYFADFSNVQYVNISGFINSVKPPWSSNKPILYSYSCLYPMQYLPQKTELAVAGPSVAIRNNGSLVTTLSMMLYRDKWRKEMLIISKKGLNPSTKIYVAVKATNLTNRFNVLLDSCYASTSPDPESYNHHYLFEGCEHSAWSKVELNGESQHAYFCFNAFIFENLKHQEVSTFYLHCVTRLCEVSSCSRLKPDCGYFSSLWKREAQYVSDAATVTSPPIRTFEISS